MSLVKPVAQRAGADALILCVCVCLILFRALELQPYSLKPLLRRAMAYESLERYRKAYVDYKTVLQIDTGVQAAHDSVHRSEKTYKGESEDNMLSTRD